MMIDLDAFKPLNDHYGHGAGDQASAAVGRLLAARFSRRPGDLVSRVGGEAFIVLLDNPAETGAMQLAAALVSDVVALGIPNVGSPLSPTLTTSVALLWGRPTSADRLEDYIRLADQALYTAKSAGRNTRRRYQPDLPRPDRDSLFMRTLTLDSPLPGVG